MFFPIVPKKKSPAAPNVGATAPSSMLKRAMSWITDGLGLPSNDVPANLSSDTITPVVEMYRPRLVQLNAPTSTDPLTGAKQFIVPANTYWELVTLGFRFDSSANAGNRTINVDVVRLNGNVVSRALSAAGNKVQPAAQTWAYSIGAHGVVGDTWTTGGMILIPTPVGLIMPPGWMIQVLDQAAIDVAGDIFSHLCLIVKEHPGVQVN